MNMHNWQHHNNEYLAAALNWLRLRLRGQIVLENDPVNAAVIEAAYQEMNAAANCQPPPALPLLAQRFGLTQFEQALLLLCAAMELDPEIAPLCAALQSDARPYPTFALAFNLFDNPAWDSLSPERPLRYWRLIEINQPGAQPLTTSALRADERIVNAIKGLNYLDDRLAPLLTPIEPNDPDLDLPSSHRTLVEAIGSALQHSAADLPLIQLAGSDRLSKRLIAAHVVATLGYRVYRLPLELLPTQVTDAEPFLRLWQRESLLLPIGLYLDAHNATKAPAESFVLQRLLSQSGIVFLDVREAGQFTERATVIFDVEKPTAAEQQMIWAAQLGATATDSPAQLSSQFNLNLPTIQRIAQQMLSESYPETFAKPSTAPLSKLSSTPLSARLWNACLLNTRPQLDALAQRIDTKAIWEDLVLPVEELNLLRQIADQVQQRHRVYEEWGFHRRMNRGMGISALFAGESGTGKTMAAEVIANTLHLNLYRIDLSAVVSKYIGETEKNLRRLFDAAEDGGAILFFDEADALFGKRSEVKDSHDRYANIEINYLLQRMEAYRGLAILATNLKTALDKAFLRRLRFVVNFLFPSIEERRLLWQKAFPPETPIQDIHFDHLARFNLTGGSIHTIALNAAFSAAQANTAVTMPFILSAARIEFRKLDRTVNEQEFRWRSLEIMEVKR